MTVFAEYSSDPRKEKYTLMIEATNMAVSDYGFSRSGPAQIDVHTGFFHDEQSAVVAALIKIGGGVTILDQQKDARGVVITIGK